MENEENIQTKLSLEPFLGALPRVHRRTGHQKTDKRYPSQSTKGQTRPEVQKSSPGPFHCTKGQTIHGDIQALPFRETLGGQQVQCLLMRAYAHLVSGTIVDLQCSQKQGIFLLKVCWVKKKKVLLVLHTHRAQLACPPLRWGFFLFLPLEVGIPFIDQHHSPCCQLDAGYHIGFSTGRGLKHSTDNLAPLVVPLGSQTLLIDSKLWQLAKASQAWFSIIAFLLVQLIS